MRTGTRLQQLQAGLEAIPQKRERGRQLGALREFARRTAEADTLLQSATAAEEGALYVFPDLSTGPVGEARRRAARAATRLAERLSRPVPAVQDPASNDDLVLIADQARAADKAVRDRWSRRMEERLKGYGALVKIAETARLPESRALATQLTLLQAASAEPPRARSGAEPLRKALQGLVTMISQLGLEGAPGRFLTAAASGQGDPRHLCDPEVRDFVERYDLWRLLVVGFR